MSKNQILDLLKSHWAEKVTQWIEIMNWLMEKDFSELEFLLKTTQSEDVKNTIKLVMEYKIKSL